MASPPPSFHRPFLPPSSRSEARCRSRSEVPESSTAAMTGDPGVIAGRADGGTDPTAPLLAPVLITLGLASIATGIVLCGFGMTRMGRAIRYVPYPVVGGFLGATGCLILLGAVRVITGHRLQFATLDQFANPLTLVRAGGGLRHGDRAVSDLAPLPQLVRTAGHSGRRHSSRAYRVLAGRASPWRRRRPRAGPFSRPPHVTFMLPWSAPKSAATPGTLLPDLSAI